MVKKIVAALAGVLLCNTAYASDYSLTAKTSVCGSYRGNWNDDGFRGAVHGTIQLNCKFSVSNGSGVSTCTSKHSDPGGRNPTTNSWGGSVKDGNVVLAEMLNADNTSVAMQLICDSSDNQCLIRIWNLESKIGMQCLVEHAKVVKLTSTEPNYKSGPGNKS